MNRRPLSRGPVAAALLLAMTLETVGTAYAAPPAPTTDLVGIAGQPTAPPTGPVFGDLTHLTFSATGPLVAALVYPRDGAASDSSAPTFDVQTGRGGGVELAINGKVVPFSKIGRRTVNNKTGETHYFYYGVALQGGPNAVRLTPLGADQARGSVVEAEIYGPGQAVRLEGSVTGSGVADGRTPVTYTIHGFDRYNHHAVPGGLVRLTIIRGDAHFLGSRERSFGAYAQTNRPANPSTVADSKPTADVVPIAVPQSQSTPFPFQSSPPSAVPSSDAQIGQAANFHGIGDAEVPLQTIDVPLGDGGIATVRLVPGLQPGEVRIAATSSDISIETQTYFAPNLRKPMVLGLATTGVGSIPGVPGETVTSANNVNARRGRIAIYGVGQVTKTAQVQVAYDTADQLQPTSQYGYVDNPAERPYQTYGDSSQLRNDALSRDHLFARIDSKKSNAMWGEFQANTAGATGDGFSQLVAGAKVELAGNNTKFSAFNARNDVAYARQLFSPTGLATLGALLHPSIVLGSDIITLVALDKRTGVILSQTALSRNIDYTLDYGTGQIRFINPPLPFDLNFNPQQVLIEYEYGGTGVNAQTTGGRLESGLGRSQAVRLGAGYVNDATGSGNYSLFGQDVTGKLSGGSWSLAHEASLGSITSISALPTVGAGLVSPHMQGNAYRAAVTQSVGANRISAAFDDTSAGFQNPFGGISTAGLLDYRVAYQRLLGKASGDTASVSFDHEQNNLATGINSTSNAAVVVQGHVTKRVSLRGGINVLTSAGGVLQTSSVLANQVNAVATGAPATGATAAPTAAKTAATTTQVDLGAEYRVAPTVAVALDRITSLSGPQQATQPSQTTAQVSVDTPHHGRLYLRQLWADAPVQSFAAATTSLTTASSSTRSTAIGIEQSIGTNTTVDSEYALENTGSGSNVYSSIGGREKFFLGDHLRGDAQLQHAASIGANGGAFNLYGLTLAYAVGTRFRATSTYQLRTGNSPGSTLDVGAAGALSDNVAAFVTSTDSNTVGFKNVDSRISVAYRPSLNDKAVTLFGYQAIDGNVSALGDHTQLLSLEELYRPDRMLEIAGRYAYKLDGDNYYPAHSSLFGLRITQRVGSRFDVAAETRFLSAHGIAGASASGFAVETGYRLGAEMRLAAGYNFSGSPDPSLALAPTRRGLYATATSVIDRIFGWGKDDL